MKFFGGHVFRPIRFVRTIMLLCLGVAVLIAHVRLSTYATDDAYIHLRAAQHFVQRGEPYFNIGERVLSSSSPVWLLVVTAVVYLSSHPIEVLALLNGSLVIGVAILAALVVVQVSPRREVPYWGIGCAVASTLLLSGVQLMETPLALFLVLAGIAVAGRSPIIAGGLLGLACGVRYECAVIAGVMVSVWFWRQRTAALRGALGIACGILPWITWIWFSFGTVVPQPVIAKRAIYDLSPLDTFVLALREFVGRYPFEQLPLTTLCYLLLLSVVLMRLLSRAEFWRALRSSAALPLILSGAGVFMSYLGASVFIFPWYVPLYTAPILFGFLLLAIERPETRLGPFVTVLVAPLVLTGARDLIAGIGPQHIFSDFAMGAKARQYVQVARELGVRFPEATLLTSEIGALGYGFPGRVYDAAGLADPEAIQYHRPGKMRRMDGGIPLEYVLFRKPDLIVAPERLAADLHDIKISSQYRMRSVPLILPDDAAVLGANEVQGSTKLVIFERHELPATVPE